MWSSSCYPGSGYTLVLAEKPKAASAIARALSSRPIKCSKWGVPYWVTFYNGERVLIASTAGHMFALDTSKRGIPVFEYQWVPRWEAERRVTHLRKFYRLLSWLSQGARLVVNACDYDIEGSVIGYLIISILFKRKDYRRMKFSSLTETELRRAFSNLLPPDTNMVEAGLCRHELDWIWGINCSRALMEAYKKATGKKIVLSAGRVQTPTLVEAIDNYIDYVTNIPLPQYTLTATLAHGQEKFEAKHSQSPFEKRADAEAIAEKAKRTGVGVVASIRKEKHSIPPPPPFNLGDLQEEASRLYGYSPYRTQKIAESLYLNALISYPRTNSQKLPPTINHSGILESLAKMGYAEEAREVLRYNPSLTPRQGTKTDPAHPAIYPTGKKPVKLSEPERRIYDLIVRRYLAAFMPPALIEKATVTIDVEGEKFIAEGTIVVRESWMKYYPRKTREKRLPELARGESVKVLRTRITESFESRVKRYNKTSLLTWMESVGIGTEATRAQIIETLFDRKYLERDKGGIKPTRLGIAVSLTVSRFFPKLTSVGLTREFEEKIEDVRRGVKSRTDVVEEAKRVVKRLVEEMQEKMLEAGETMAAYLNPQANIEKCPLCNLPAIDGLCIFHKRALEKLLENLDEWSRRTGLDRKSVLTKISKQKSVGQAVREVAKAILSGDIII